MIILWLYSTDTLPLTKPNFSGGLRDALETQTFVVSSFLAARNSTYFRTAA
jgi:hypothetical protein